MDYGDPHHAYLNLANALFENRISERNLSHTIEKLPPLEKTLLNKLAEIAEGFALTEPRHGWAIARVADQAATSQKCEPFLQSLAAWYLSRAANHWGQPKKVKTAIARARRGFRKLGEKGWIAACGWQSNILSWTKSDIVLSVKELQQALIDLQQEGFFQFVPDCQRALGYSQLLIGEFEKASGNFLASEAAFAAKGDTLNQAHCWLNEASLLRRQSHYDEALLLLNRALKVFEKVPAPIDIAHVYYQLATINLLRTENLSQAISYLEKAQHIYVETNLELWWADCTTNLGTIYMQNGLFKKADKLLKHARPSLTRHGVLGLLADNLNDSGKLNMLRGRPRLSIKQYQDAEKLHEMLGIKLQAAIDAANLGEVYGQIGQYQNALHHLERAITSLKTFESPHRLGSCERYMAMIWSELGRPTLAHEHLDRAVACFEKTKQKALLASVYNSRASVYIQQGQPTEAIECLKKSQSYSEEQGLQPQVALASRLLGEALLNAGRGSEAVDHLMRANAAFAEMGMTYERAAVLVALGFYYIQSSNVNSARAAFNEALQISQIIFPEIEWRTQAGLADLAKIEGNIQNETHAYQLGVKALSKIRQNLWQPSLVGSYLNSPSEFFDRATALIAKVESAEHALGFIEENKATGFLQQLLVSPNAGNTKKSQELNDIKAQINWLQQQFRVSFDTSFLLKSEIQTRQLKSQLIEKASLYNVKTEQLERQYHSGNADGAMIPSFDLTVFRTLATQRIGNSWLALDYHLTDNELIIIAIAPTSVETHVVPLSMRIRMALKTATQPKYDQVSQGPTQRDLGILGRLLIPAQIVDLLTPDTYLFLVPHKYLHRIPWAALQPDIDSEPLVRLCMPCIIPSLRGLVAFWKRTTLRRSIRRKNGLLVGVSNFQGIRTDLPYVKDEILALKQKLGPRGSLLSEKDATWQNLKGLCTKDGQNRKRAGLSRFDWFHIASHAFADMYTGRLSGIALADGDVWLDNLIELAPLPTLVTLSACDSIYSYIYSGDEHMGLPATCLAAGADCVVGSIWPIVDKRAAEFSISFYDKYWKGSSPAQAVAQIQRELADQNEPINSWAGFVCVGAA